jgi:cell division septation protein DedD
MLNQVGGAAAEVLLKFCVVFVIALCSFAVGTFAGKKFTEDQYRLSSLESGHHGDREMASVAKVEEKPDNVLSEEDLKSLTEEFSHDDAKKIEASIGDKQKEAEALAQQALDKLEEEMKVMDKKDAHHDATAKGAEVRQPQTMHLEAKLQPHEKKLDHTTLVAERIATNQEKVVVAPKKEVSRIPSSLPVMQAATALGKYTVQVGAYKSEEEAKILADDLMKKGLPAYYVKAELKGQTWYRVSVGTFADQDEANKNVQKVYQEAKLKGFVTKIVK